MYTMSYTISIHNFTCTEPVLKSRKKCKEIGNDDYYFIQNHVNADGRSIN